MTTVKAWIKASRVCSQSYIFLPLLFGQMLAVYDGFRIDWGLFVLTQLYGLFIQLYIVYANDCADYETDCQNRTFTIYSGGSRVLTDSDLRPEQLLKVAVLMALFALVVGFVMAIIYGRLLAPLFVIVSILLLFVYSFIPCKVSYRGGGEILQMLGTALVLPLMGYYAQSNQVLSFYWPVLLVFFPTHIACAMATSLPDEPSDRLSEKRTSSVLFGLFCNKLFIIILNILGVVALFFMQRFKLNSVTLIYLLTVPILCIIGQILTFPRSEPGRIAMVYFVTFAVMTTLSFSGGLALYCYF